MTDGVTDQLPLFPLTSCCDLLDLLAQQEAVIECVQLLTLWQLIAGSHQCHKGDLQARGAGVGGSVQMCVSHPYVCVCVGVSASVRVASMCVGESVQVDLSRPESHKQRVCRAVDSLNPPPGTWAAGPYRSSCTHLDAHTAVVKEALVEQCEQCVEDGAVGLEDLINERNLAGWGEEEGQEARCIVSV